MRVASRIMASQSCVVGRNAAPNFLIGPRHDQGVDVELARLAMRHELEAILEKRPHRQNHRIVR